MLRRRLLLTLVLTPLASNLAFAQSAPTWPTRDVHVFVPQSAGSALDIVTRSVMEQVAPRLGQPIVVENRIGAGNTIAMAAVARAEPDGYTVLANSSTHSLVPVTYATLPFDTFRDLAPIIPLSNTPLVMVVSSSKGYTNVADFVADAKAKRGAMNYVLRRGREHHPFGDGSVPPCRRLRSGARAVQGRARGTDRGAGRTGRFLFHAAPGRAAVSAGRQAQATRRQRIDPCDRLAGACRRSKRRAIPRPPTISGSACSCRRRPRRRSWTGFTAKPKRRCRPPY